MNVLLSPVQRRVRNLLLNEEITNQMQLDYRLLGYKTELIHIF